MIPSYDDLEGPDPEPDPCEHCGEILGEDGQCPNTHELWGGVLVENGDVRLNDLRGNNYLAFHTVNGWRIRGEKGDISHAAALRLIVALWQGGPWVDSYISIEKFLVSELKTHVRELEAEVSRLRQELISQETTFIWELQSMRGRLLGVITGELTRWLETALEASTMKPARISVVNERLSASLKIVKEEALWLKSFLRTPK